MQNPSLLTIAEASKTTGRSPSTIRRLIHEIAGSPNYRERSGIDPSPSTVASLRKKGENFTWRIRRDVLDRYLSNTHGALAEKEKWASGHSSSSQKPKDDILSLLRVELELKNRQIEQQYEVIRELNARLREGNILLGALQNRLALPEAKNSRTSLVEVSSVKKPARHSNIAFRRASTRASMEASRESALRKGKKRGLLRWLFRRRSAGSPIRAVPQGSAKGR